MSSYREPVDQPGALTPGSEWSDAGVAISCGEVMARLKQLLRDLRRIVGGFAAFLKYLVTRDRVEIGLGQLSAESSVATRGVPNRYFVTIASARGEPMDVTLAIDIHAVDSPTRGDGHYAYFARRLKARPHASTFVEARYDWLTGADFLLGGTPSAPDDFWRGTLDRFARYSVNAVLLDPHGDPLEVLTVYQELAP
jgi:hypothetical protein